MQQGQNFEYYMGSLITKLRKVIIIDYHYATGLPHFLGAKAPLGIAMVSEWVSPSVSKKFGSLAISIADVRGGKGMSQDDIQ